MPRVLHWKEVRSEAIKVLVERIEITITNAEDDIVLRAMAKLLDDKGLHTTAKDVRHIADQMIPFEEKT